MRSTVLVSEGKRQPRPAGIVTDTVPAQLTFLPPCPEHRRLSRPDMSSLSGRSGCLALLGEPLELPVMHVRQPIQRGRWAHPRIVGNAAVAQALHIRAIRPERP